jgi:hypothetical protein
VSAGTASRKSTSSPRRTAVPVGLFGLHTNTRRVDSSMAAASAGRSWVSAGPPGRPGVSGTWTARAPATRASNGYISNERQAKARLVPGSL